MNKNEFLQLVIVKIKENPEWTNEVIHATTIGLLQFSKEVNEKSSNTEFMANALNIILKKLVQFRYAQKILKTFNLQYFPEIEKLLKS